MMLVDLYTAALAARHLQAELTHEVSRRGMLPDVRRTIRPVPWPVNAAPVCTWIRSLRGKAAPESASSC